MKNEFKIMIGLVIGCIILAFIFVPSLREILKPDEKGYLKIVKYEMFSNGDYVGVKGVVKNIAKKNISYCEFRVKYYDKNNTYLGYSLETLQDIPVGGTRNFFVEPRKFSQQVDHISFEVLTTYFGD